MNKLAAGLLFLCSASCVPNQGKITTAPQQQTGIDLNKLSTEHLRMCLKAEGKTKGIEAVDACDPLRVVANTCIHDVDDALMQQLDLPACKTYQEQGAGEEGINRFHCSVAMTRSYPKTWDWAKTHECAPKVAEYTDCLVDRIHQLKISCTKDDVTRESLLSSKQY